MSNLKSRSQFDSTLARLPTEAVNRRTRGLDRMTTRQLVRTMQREDATVAAAVGRCLPQVAAVIDGVLPGFAAGGRLIYIGAGTSGRLGVLDASECPPTFGVKPGRVHGVVAGGTRALTRSIEGAEDNPSAARRDLQRLRLCPRDAVIGISASGRTPYTVAAVVAARAARCFTAAITSNPQSPLAAAAALAIAPRTGAEALAGSTRLKAGTAQKMVLNMISTGVMVRSGYVLGNLMLGVQPTNAKLRARATRILVAASALRGAAGRRRAEAALRAAGGDVRTAMDRLRREAR